MWSMMKTARFWAAFPAMLLGLSLGHAQASSVTTYKGKFSDGATYLIEVPSNWNGTLVLYSHGYVVPGQPNPAKDAGDPLTEAALLQQGYALAGSAYSATGWALQQAFQDQI